MWFRQWSTLLHFMTSATWLLEMLAFPLLLSPFGQPWLRRFAIVTLGALHVGIALTMRLALFEASMILSFILFLSGSDWNLLRRALRRPPDPDDAPTPLPGRERRWLRSATGWAAAALLGLVVVDGYNRNVAHPIKGPPPVKRPRYVRAVLEVPQLIQDWHMFAPNPPTANVYWAAEAVNKEGLRIDPLTGGDPRGWLTSSSRHWFKYLGRLSMPSFEQLRPHLARYLVARYNRYAVGDQQIVALSLLVIREQIPRPGDTRRPEGIRSVVWPPPARAARPPGLSEMP
jgi:hypothetical protein